jgi:hypothetical protein
MYRVYAIFLLALLAIGCEKDNNNTSYNDIPVIESYLQAGSRISVTLKHQVAFSSVSAQLGSVDGLSVILSDDSTTIQLAQTGTGTYADTGELAQAGHNYSISFTYNKKPVLATTQIPAKPTGYAQSATSISIAKITQGSFPSGGFTQPDPIDLTWNNPDGSYYMVLVKNIESKPELIFDTTGIGSPPSKVFRNQPTTSSKFSINASQFQYFGKHLLILYRIQADYAALYNTNGTSSQNLTTLSSGLTNAEGIFTGINADTLTLQVKKK